MIRHTLFRFGIAACLAALMLLAACSGSSSSNPRKVVLQLFGAMEKNDQSAVAHTLDLPALMESTQEDYAFQSDSPRVWTNPKDILDDLTDDGKTKKEWFSYQRVVGDAEVMGDHATVDVTFINKAASKGYRTKFGLHKVDGKWKIYTFKTEGEPPQTDTTESSGY